MDDFVGLHGTRFGHLAVCTETMSKQDCQLTIHFLTNSALNVLS